MEEVEVLSVLNEVFSWVVAMMLEVSGNVVCVGPVTLVEEMPVGTGVETEGTMCGLLGVMV
jgi:hypothetical protein